MLPRIVQSIQRLLLPVIDSVGFVDASSVRVVLARVGTLLTHHSTGGAWVESVQESLRSLWVLLTLVRVALHADQQTNRDGNHSARGCHDGTPNIK